jgi:HPt (histidine-containing phosphotransfer) domain-containing protein
MMIVKVDAVFESIMPAFWKEMNENIGVMKVALRQSDFDTLESEGHKTKGTALNYGVAAIGDLSRSVELAAQANSPGQVHSLLDELESCLEHIEIVYE